MAVAQQAEQIKLDMVVHENQIFAITSSCSSPLAAG
jgi:hypothetical protein